MTRRPVHHPDESLLLAYAAGNLPQPQAFVIAAHLAFCPDCRAAVRDGERLGGALLDDLPAATAPIPMPAPPARRALDVPVHPAARTIDQVMRGQLPAGPWRQVLPDMAEMDLLQSADRRLRTRLLKIRAGAAMPRHTHDGSELTLVLQGQVHDGDTVYGPGDLACSDRNTIHAPRAGAAQDCICLTVTEGHLHLAGWLGQLLRPLLRY